jgi:hypothetical protein
MRNRSFVAAALALAASPVLFAGPASATPVFNLRVEAPGTTIDPGTYYAPRNPIASQRGQLVGSGNCQRAPGDIPLDGRSALGLVASAANATPAMRPLLVAEDSFGKRICRIGGFNETDVPFTGWLYRVNHAPPTLAADLVKLSRTDQVLWVFANFGTGANTGDELFLSAPFRNAPGVVQVSVSAVDFNGVSKAAPDGTVVSGGTAPVTTVGGVAAVPVAAGTTTLRATGPGAAPTEIPSNPAPVCAAVDVADCPTQPGRRIIGSNVRDVLKGTPGPDVIRSRGGKDTVRVRGGGADVVNCGNGRDKVVADSSDRVRSCEKGRRA